jgi:hypothetical protein
MTKPQLRTLQSTMLAAAICAVIASSAQAQIVLRITEMWPGQPGADVTNDWFEVTNFGTLPWISGVSPALRVDDNSADILASAAVTGIGDILPGESVMILMEADATDKQTFFDVWNPVKPQSLGNIGIADGSGLGMGQPNDGASIFMGGAIQDLQTYTGSDSGRSWDVLLGQYSVVGNPSGAVQTLVLGGDGGAIGSPGSVPEPTSIVLLMAGLSALALPRRRR